MKRFVRAGLSAAVALNAAAIITGTIAATAPAAYANAPGSPGTPSAPTVVYQETFENGQASGAASAPSLLSGYTGAAPGNMTYSADSYYEDPSQCNGLIASFNSANPSGWCNNNASYWHYVNGFAAALSSLESTPSNDDHVLVDFTTGGAGSANAVVIQSTSNNLPLSGTTKRFLTMSANVAEAYCSNGPAGNAKLNFYLETAGGELPLQSQPVEPCNSPFTSNVNESVPGVGTVGYQTGTVPALGSVLTTPANFGFKVVNSATVSGSGGNDVAYDNFTVLDATPQLDANFSAASVGVNTATNLVYTITNTSDLADKDGWEFSNALPSGLVVDGTPSSTCAAADLSAITNGSTSVAVTAGDIAQGVSSCAVTIPVSAAKAGTYTVTGSSATLVGLDAPNSTSLNVVNTVVANNDYGVVNTGGSVNVAVLTNDTSADGQALGTPTIVSQPAATASGTASVNPDGTITFHSTRGWSGLTSFRYQVCDTGTPQACSDGSPGSTQGVVTITVKNVFTAHGVTTGQNDPLTKPLSDQVSVTGAPLQPTTVTQVTPPTHGSISIDATTGAITYSPAPGYSGKDSYTIHVCDTSHADNTTHIIAQCSTLTIPVTVRPNVVTAPNKSATIRVNHSAGFNVMKDVHSASGQKVNNPTISTSPKHGRASVNANGTITYQPRHGFSGVDSFKYTVCDTGTPKACATRVITVHVKAPVVVPSLPDTGGPEQGWLLGGMATLLGGLALVIAGRRRKA